MPEAAAHPTTVLLAGATGLVGSRVLQRLPGHHRLIALSRRPLPSPAQASLQVVVAAQADWSDAAISAAAGGKPIDCWIHCLGSTRNQAGSDAAFIAIDRDLPLRLAEQARRLGARQAIVLSSVGADPRSRSLYLRCKGELERAIGALGFARLDRLRPGLLLGPRSDRRVGEALAQRLLPPINRWLCGGLSRYRAIDADAVAAAIAALCGRQPAGNYLHEYQALRALAAACDAAQARPQRPPGAGQAGDRSG